MSRGDVARLRVLLSAALGMYVLSAIPTAVGQRIERRESEEVRAEEQRKIDARNKGAQISPAAAKQDNELSGWIGQLEEPTASSSAWLPRTDPTRQNQRVRRIKEAAHDGILYDDLLTWAAGTNNRRSATQEAIAELILVKGDSDDESHHVHGHSIHQQCPDDDAQCALDTFFESTRCLIRPVCTASDTPSKDPLEKCRDVTKAEQQTAFEQLNAYMGDLKVAAYETELSLSVGQEEKRAHLTVAVKHLLSVSARLPCVRSHDKH